MASRELKAIFCDPDLEWSRALRTRLREKGISVSATAMVKVLLEWIRPERPDLVVLGEFPPEFKPDLLVGLLRSRWPDLPVMQLLPPVTAEDKDLLRDDLDLQYVAVRPVPDDEILAAILPILHGPASAPPKRRPPVVLCVDDDPLSLAALGRMLRRKGYRVAAFDSPERALEALPIVRPDLAILDVAMAGMNGLQMTEELRELHGCLPIILLSGLDSDREIERGYRSGATTYLTKPCEPAEVLSIVENLLRTPGKGSGRRCGEVVRPVC
jgi:DNA-binding response OmpR family regulator